MVTRKGQRPRVGTEAEDGEMWLQIKAWGDHQERTGAEKVLPRPSEGGGPADTLILDVWPHSCDRSFLLFRDSSLW